MSVELALQIIQAAAVVAGVAFGLAQLRQLQRQRDVSAAIELLRPLQVPETAAAVLRLHALPENLDSASLKAELGPEFGSAVALLAIFESLGPLVARGHIPIELYADFYRGATVLSWSKMKRYVEEQREAGWVNLFEWLQWLADQMERRKAWGDDVPAFERFRQWKSVADYNRLAVDNRVRP